MYVLCNQNLHPKFLYVPTFKYVMRRLKCKFKMLALAPPKSKSQSVEYNLTHFDEKTRHSVAVALFVV